MIDHHHVVRIDIEPDDENPKRSQTHGWQVRVSFEGERRTKFFADRKYGGRDKALELALAYRDELLAERKELHQDGPPVRRAQTRSTSGVAGVRLAFKNDTPYVEANWVTDDGRSVSSFSVARWGLRKAVWQACKARAVGRGVRSPQRVQDMFDVAYPKLKAFLDAHSQDGSVDGRAESRSMTDGQTGDGYATDEHPENRHSENGHFEDRHSKNGRSYGRRLPEVEEEEELVG
jgi:hypothetical protein